MKECAKVHNIFESANFLRENFTLPRKKLHYHTPTSARHPVPHHHPLAFCGGRS